MFPIKVLANPVRYGYKECATCSGLGSYLQEKHHIFCPLCNGTGIVKNKQDQIRVFKKNKKVFFIKSMF